MNGEQQDGWDVDRDMKRKEKKRQFECCQEKEKEKEEATCCVDLN